MILSYKPRGYVLAFALAAVALISGCATTPRHDIRSRSSDAQRVGAIVNDLSYAVVENPIILAGQEQTGIPTFSSGGQINGAMSFGTGLGAVAQITGPTDQTLALAGGAGQAASLTGGTPATLAAGGAVNIAGAASIAGATGAGGAVSIVGGAAGSTNDAGGAITMTTGAGVGTGLGGAFTIKPGLSGTSATTTAPEMVVVGVAGNGTSGSGLIGGIASITGGAGKTTGAGGIAKIVGGAGGPNGAGGAVQVTGGLGGSAAGTGGALTFAAGAGNVATAAGGAVTINGGAGVTSGAGGNLTLSPGVSPSGTAGNLILQGATTTNSTAMTIVSTQCQFAAPPKISAYASAGGTTPALGTTCPASSGTVHWMQIVSSAGTTAYIPVWEYADSRWIAENTTDRFN